MDEQKPKSSWDELLKEIGAAPPPEALQRKRPAIETTFEPPPEVDVEAVKPKPGDWNELASELGIEVKEEPARKAPETTPYAGPSSNALEASFAEIEPMGSDFEDVVEEEIADIDFVGDEGDEEEEEDDFLAAKRKPELDPNALSGEAARNAFEALFQAGSFAALPPLKKPEPAEPPRQRGGPQWRELDESRSESDEEEIVFEEVTEGEALEGEEAGEEQRGRPRRRRRRRGRGRDGQRRASGEGAAALGDEEDEEELAETAGTEESAKEGEELEGDKPARRRRRRRRRGKGEPGEDRADRAAANGKTSAAEDDDEDEDDESLATAGGDEEEAGDSPRESHKNIPTWSEAISVMVDINLQSRKNAPSRPSGPRERGRGGRGRGRGGGGRRGKS